MASTMDIALAAAGTNDCPIYHILVAPGRRGLGYAALVARNWVPHKETKWIAGDHRDAAVAAAVDPAAPLKSQREAASGGDAVRRIQHGSEANLASVVAEEAEQGGLPVVDTEAAEEPGVGGEAAPALADGAGARERRRARREAEKYFPEDVLVVQRGHRVTLRRSGLRGRLGAPRPPHHRAAALTLPPGGRGPSRRSTARERLHRRRPPGPTAAPPTSLPAIEVWIQDGWWPPTATGRGPSLDRSAPP